MSLGFDAVLFDCDGVLVDSEPITNGVLHTMLVERGWALSAQDCWNHFIGKAVKDESALIEHHTGQPVTDGWLASFRARRDAALHELLEPIHGIHEALKLVEQGFGEAMACASGADRGKVELQLRKTGLMPYFEGRIFSGHEMPRSKPAPDVYLAAARALGVQADRCAVVEDTVTGVTAGVAAGATVFAYSPPAAGAFSADALREAGATHIFRRMQHLPELLLGGRNHG